MSTTQRKLNLGQGPTKAIPAPPGSVAFRPPFHERAAAAPRPDQRVHITAEQLPETATKQYSIGTFVLSLLLAAGFTWLLFLAELEFGTTMALLVVIAVFFFAMNFDTKPKCSACREKVEHRASRCPHCTSFFGRG